ncbi:hypothetical protein [Shewanella donghaensis]|uniref:hypothetical protein n=1 Tax=Shewanella donghaensis TaxID=238836 RepID=UPI0011843CF7|nr:hypothetical protein [Shewanella donghaensis]
MPRISFNFHCYRQVPFYAQLCNQYMNDTRFDFTAGYANKCYFLEVEATEQQLATLADEIAANFLYSIWLDFADITVIEKRKGSKKSITNPQGMRLVNHYCSQCQPHMVNDSDEHFLNINTPCHQCQGHEHLSDIERSLTTNDIQSFAQRLEQDSILSIAVGDNTQITLSKKPVAHVPNCQTLFENVLICNTSKLNHYFVVQPFEVLALSSLEKPFIKLRTQTDQLSQHSTGQNDLKLTKGYYTVHFASSRFLMVLSHQLSTLGIDWLYINVSAEHNGDIDCKNNISPIHALTRATITRVNNAWVEIAAHGPITSTGMTPLHDDSSYQHYSATWTNKVIHCHYSPDTEAHSTVKLTGIDAATCAMHAGLLNLSEQEINKIANRKLTSEDKKTITTATLFFSHDNRSSLITQDKQQNITEFLVLPTFPHSGADIAERLKQDEAKIFDKFAIEYPTLIKYLASTRLNNISRTDNLQTFIAIAAMIILEDEQLTHLKTTVSKADAFHALAQSYNGSNAPRIDFPLCSENECRTINWRRTLASLMSFKLAGANPAILAFGFFDSLADYLSNWLDHLEQQQGVDALVLAGNDLSYSVFADRLCIRANKNYPIIVNRELDLDGANLAIGGLYLAKRRLVR